MKDEAHWSLARNMCDKPRVIIAGAGTLEWTVFRGADCCFLLVCTPKDENTPFLPLVQFYWKLLPGPSSQGELRRISPDSRIYERAVTVRASLPKGFSGRIQLFLAIDNHPPVDTSIDWQ